MEISRPALAKILSGETSEPFEKTQRAIYEWVQDRTTLRVPAYLEGTPEELDKYRIDGNVSLSPEAELLEYFLEHHGQMATLMSRSSEGLNPEDRRKVALALLNAFKRMAIEAGEKIPPFLFELERKFVGE